MNTKVSAVVLAPGHQTATIRPANGVEFDLRELSDRIGSPALQAVLTHDGHHVLLFRDQPEPAGSFNETASELLRLCGFTAEPQVFGPAVVCPL